jgi:hypothetical protein
MYRPQPGDRFTFQILPGEYLSGRVLLDVESQCVAPRRLSADAPMSYFGEAVLVEIYGASMAAPGVDASNLLLPSLFLTIAGFSGGRWKVIDNQAVDPAKVDFPATTLYVQARPHLTWGELSLPIEMSGEEYERLTQRPIVHTSTLDLLCLVALGRETEVNPKRGPRPDLLRLGHHDLRFAPAGAEVFARAGLGDRGTYYDEALRRGFDTRRFYELDGRTLLTVCPYCWAPRTPEEICWACGEDTSHDSAIELSRDELDRVERKSCPRCQSRIPASAIRCSNCRLEQPPLGT